MKNLSVLVLVGIFLTGCAGQIPTPQLIEVTRQIRVVRQVEVTRLITVTAQPVPARMIFPTDCLTRLPGMDYSRYDGLYGQTIGGCSFLASSPDGQTLAFSAMTCLENHAGCGEAVKVLRLGEEKPLTIAFSPTRENMWVGYLGWSSNGKLVFSWDTIAGGVGTYISEPGIVENLTSRPASAQLVPAGLFQWNSSRTAFITFNPAGDGTCYSLFSGYDFTSKKIFPDIPTALNMNDTYVRIMPIDGNIKDWWDTDVQVDLLITPLEYDYARQDYMFLPTIAGRITLTPSGPIYTTLASSATESFYFKGVKGSRTVESKPYEIHYCLGG